MKLVTAATTETAESVTAGKPQRRRKLQAGRPLGSPRCHRLARRSAGPSSTLEASDGMQNKAVLYLYKTFP